MPTFGQTKLKPSKLWSGRAIGFAEWQVTERYLLASFDLHKIR
jgi:hypothetical protein